MWVHPRGLWKIGRLSVPWVETLCLISFLIPEFLKITQRECERDRKGRVGVGGRE